jgi:hypothetical protein
MQEVRRTEKSAELRSSQNRLSQKILQLSWHVDEGGQRFEMTAARDIRKGEEVFTTYGSKTNEQWMLYYGEDPLS